ncbi:BTAD domain-containing putative transcriptional regulator [Streptomyces sp. M19]
MGPRRTLPPGGTAAARRRAPGRGPTRPRHGRRDRTGPRRPRGRAPWREHAWGLLARALYRTGRQGDALSVLRRARTLLVEQLGWTRARTCAAWRRTSSARPITWARASRASRASRVSRDSRDSRASWVSWTRRRPRGRWAGVGPRGRRLRPVRGVRRPRAPGVDGGAAAEPRGDRRQRSGGRPEHRVAAVEAAEELGDPELAARVIGAYDVPAIWTRSDDPEQAARVVAAAERTLAALPPSQHEGREGHGEHDAWGGRRRGGDGHDAVRARLLTTIALESRGTSAARPRIAARQAERLARGLDDPRCWRSPSTACSCRPSPTRVWPRGGRDRRRADRPVRPARAGHLRGARSPRSPPGARRAGRLRRGRPARDRRGPAGRAQRAAAGGRVHPVVPGAAARRDRPGADGRGGGGRGGGGLPGGRRRTGRRRDAGSARRAAAARAAVPAADARPARPDRRTPRLGPVRALGPPLVLLAQDRRTEAAAAVAALPEPPHDLLFEALWCLAARAAVEVGTGR